MRKQILSLVFSGIILFGSCASAKPSWEYKEPPTTLLDAVGVQEKENKKLFLLNEKHSLPSTIFNFSFM